MKTAKTQNFLILFFVLFFNLILAQESKVVIIDKSNNEKINKVKILSNNGNIIGVSNDKGEFNINLSNLKSNSIISIETSHFLFEEKKINLNQLSDTIKLVPKINELEEVVIKHKKGKYFKTIAYFRTWRLINNKLQNYVEGIKEVYIPYDSSNSNKEYFTQYISYKDSLFNKNFIDITFGGDGFLFTKIYRDDYYSRYKKIYTLKKKSEIESDLFENDSKVGIVTFDNNGILIEINKSDIAENVKVFGKLLSYKDYTYEKWNNCENRHLSMSRNTICKEIKSKNKTLTIETVSEIYLKDEEIIDDLKPLKYKNIVNPDKSFFNIEFYNIYRNKYPMQKEINNQLKNLKQNENIY